VEAVMPVVNDVGTTDSGRLADQLRYRSKRDNTRCQISPPRNQRVRDLLR
jgi:hypothetical protein